MPLLTLSIYRQITETVNPMSRRRFAFPKERSLLLWIVDVGDKRVAPGDGYDRKHDPEKSGSDAFSWGPRQDAFGPEWVGDKD